MLQSDGFRGSDYLEEGGFYAGDDVPENLSIEFDRFLQILNEKSDPTTRRSTFSCGPDNYEKASPPQDVVQPTEASLLEGRLLESTPSCSSPYHFEASDFMDNGLSYGYECSGNFNFIEVHSPGGFDQGKPDTSLLTDDKYSLCGDHLSLTPGWLTQSSSEHDNPPWDFAASPVNALTSNSTGNQLLQNETPNWTIQSKISSGEADHYSDYTSYVNMISSGSKIENGFRLTKDETSYQKEVKSETESGFSYGTVDARGMADLQAQQRNLCTYPQASIFKSDVSLPVSPHSELDNGHITSMERGASAHCSPMSLCRGLSSDDFDASFADHDLGQFFPGTYHHPSVLNDEQTMAYIKNEENDLLFIPHTLCSSSEMNLGVQEGIVSVSQSANHNTNADVCLPNGQCAELNSYQDTISKFEASGHCSPVSFSRNYASSINGRISADHASGDLLPAHQTSISHKNNMACRKDGKDERGNELIASSSTFNHLGKGIDESVEKSLSRDESYDDSDADICIVEEMSNPRHRPLMADHGKSYGTSQRSTFSEPLHYPGVGGFRLKESDERLTFHAALQDLSQTKSEASPPDGVLAVPLLRHQRIALSWMVQKETTSIHCSGGILADDQGLGKTISIIALILLERPPSSKLIPKAVEQGDFKALNLDDDDDDDDDGAHGNSVDAAINRGTVKSQNSFVAGKGRPAAGTLVVCPTSVLRQWDEELRNKVTREGNLSVLVYHGSNRTKDPDELAKHDVVLTTYSIVSMEVPKQPLVDQDDEEKFRVGDDDLSMGLSSRKRKYPPSKKSLKKRKGEDGALLESVARPLARVGWFRVVLDEAQSIKNHRTQVARACWGLRAKRRWCLSGTPIQNAVDDLYSYFRFLRYDPYAAYKSFCSTIKGPIQRNPNAGYKKLQAVLKTVMLRRTKGTLIDGKPIINLPPKLVSLKKVDFSEAERGFYSRLEADSRAQFKVYAAAGTVKQNYVNILLMLLRLRQACDHPLLVRGYDSDSLWKSSVETAKKLPREKQIELLYCLEIGLAICSLCNDPPEDAVVTVCGHVFCNQCICEHLTGDDNLCPAANCKVHLSVTSVFSKAALKTSLSELGRDSSPDSSELFNTPELCAEALSSDSSKIKAALEILQAVSKPKYSASKTSCRKSKDDFSTSPESASDCNFGVESNSHDKSHLDMPKGSSSPVGEKAIVFSQWTRMLDLLEARLKSSSIQYRRLDGTMSVVARDKAVKDFNNLPEVSVMIMSLKAASLGLNMVAACHVVLLDLWWNPTTEDQAIDRAHRIGQTRPVIVSRLTVKDTVEDRILALQQKKREMVASAFGEDETGSRQTRLTVEDLEYLFMA